jgi:hypothetical protein
MLRNAPDLQTRIKLQKLQDSLLNKSQISLGNSKGKNSTNGQTKSQHGNRAYFPSLSDGRDHTSGSTRSLSSHTYP